MLISVVERAENLHGNFNAVVTIGVRTQDKIGALAEIELPYIPALEPTPKKLSTMRKFGFVLRAYRPTTTLMIF